ncbi:NAD-dependent epimerase/dehydratase [Aspergillus costaricaensis CBS 115574]|uniref:NAD-dependent epimerase/dehydratase n=1 Tax=Aspergillus costaricaensis CBS 115574 TaxID=1448317 RepID=A0ACD1IF64_9EURO|nr:NAD-dependent epimerase/dehydratase [Aspergillus costaricaensis CBS 115574]RAK89220.1 NAD-dependent epimerase/dehydratase [Aspergillus costaricaensis CBS 115574]
MSPLPQKVAFVTGANGISGYAIVEHLIRQPKHEWSKIIVSSRRPLPTPWIDPRVEFVAVDFLESVETIISKLKDICAPVTHAYFTSYVHDDDFRVLREKNVPLFRNFLDAVDAVCPGLQRVSLQTGGKYYGVHLGPVKVPLEESFPRYDDQGFNFYYDQEDYLREVQKRRNTWSYNIIRPNAINGFAPHANGMSEALTIAIYMLICRELHQPATFPGNEYFWNSIDDNSYAPSLADLTVWASSQEHCRDEVFNHVNGDVFVWKHMWQDVAKYFGVEVPEPKFEKAAGQAKTLSNEIDMVEWAKDKRAVWETVVQKHGGKVEAFEWGTWGFFNWATGKSWLTISSVNKARKYGWQRHDNTFDTWIETYRSFENAGVLPSHDSLARAD